MLYELLTTSSMAGIAFYTYLFKGKNSKDHEKIKTIADAAGLNTKEGSIRIYRKVKRKDYAEYIYKIPLGLSFKQFEDHKQFFIDGLNNKSKSDINLTNFKNINFKGDIIKQLKDIFNNRVRLDKQLEMEYDGMLKFRVYDNGLGNSYPITKEIMDSCGKWIVPIGVTYSEQVNHDFESGPHILLGGTTDMGKSTILNVIINTLIHKHPNDVEFTLIDLKDGLEFSGYRDMKQVKYFAEDLDQAKKVLGKVKNDMSDTFNFLKKTGKKDVKKAGIKKRHFVIIDEAAELSVSGELDSDVKKKKIDCDNYIKDIARRGRASGIRLIYSTQYPTAETVSSQVKRNLITRICLPVDTATASTVVLDEGGAENLPITQGRAIYKRHRKETMQAYFIDDELSNEIITPHINIRAKEDENVNRTARKNTAVFKAL